MNDSIKNLFSWHSIVTILVSEILPVTSTCGKFLKYPDEQTEMDTFAEDKKKIDAAREDGPHCIFIKCGGFIPEEYLITCGIVFAPVLHKTICGC